MRQHEALSENFRLSDDDLSTTWMEIKRGPPWQDFWALRFESTGSTDRNCDWMSWVEEVFEVSEISSQLKDLNQSKLGFEPSLRNHQYPSLLECILSTKTIMIHTTQSSS